MDLPPNARDRVRRSMIERHRARGPLLATVSVRVYAEVEEPQVTFAGECVLGPDADGESIAAVVARARDALADWR